MAQAVWKPGPKTEVRTSVQNLKLNDWLVESNFTYERGFQLCFGNLCDQKRFHTV